MHTSSVHLCECDAIPRDRNRLLLSPAQIRRMTLCGQDYRTTSTPCYGPWRMGLARMGSRASKWPANSGTRAGCSFQPDGRCAIRHTSVPCNVTRGRPLWLTTASISRDRPCPYPASRMLLFEAWCETVLQKHDFKQPQKSVLGLDALAKTKRDEAGHGESLKRPRTSVDDDGEGTSSPAAVDAAASVVVPTCIR